MNVDNIQNKHVCICGREFESSQALIGHYSHCLIHKDDLHQKQLKEQKQKESRRLLNGMFKCENPDCGKEHDGSYGSGRFCSAKCRHHYSAIQSAKTAIQNGTRKCNFLSSKNIHNRAKFGRWKCIRCNLIFDTRAKLVEHNHQSHPIGNYQAWNKGLTKDNDIRIANGALKISATLKNGYATGIIVSPAQTSDFWTKERREIQRQRAIERKIGGYHKHGGKGHRGWYKGYWCDSSWELAWVIYNLDHGVKFERCKEKFKYEFEGKQSTYNPDFILSSGEYVEIKGWTCPRWFAKVNAFPKGKILLIIGKDKIQKYLDYVIIKYGTNFISLYET